MARIGILGGSFHPIHNGHIRLGRFCLDKQLVDEVWFVPTGCSYLKAHQNMLSGRERFRLCEIALAGERDMRACDVEIKRDGNSYTYETLEELGRLYPEHSFFFIIGADCLFSMETWYQPERIFANCTILAAYREGNSVEEFQRKAQELEEKYHARIVIMNFPEYTISSTEIRNRIARGESVEGMLPEALCLEIRRMGYFSKDSSTRGE